jgi:hypothetical protein
VKVAVARPSRMATDWERVVGALPRKPLASVTLTITEPRALSKPVSVTVTRPADGEGGAAACRSSSAITTSSIALVTVVPAATRPRSGERGCE